MRVLVNFFMALVIAGSSLLPAHAEGGYKKKDSPLKPFHELMRSRSISRRSPSGRGIA